MNEFDYNFKIRKPQDIALQMSVIYKNLGYSELDKNKAFAPYGITIDDMEKGKTVKDITAMIEVVNDAQKDKMLELCNQLQERWIDYKERYLKNLEKS